MVVHYPPSSSLLHPKLSEAISRSPTHAGGNQPSSLGPSHMGSSPVKPGPSMMHSGLAATSHSTLTGSSPQANSHSIGTTSTLPMIHLDDDHYGLMVSSTLSHPKSSGLSMSFKEQRTQPICNPSMTTTTANNVSMDPSLHMFTRKDHALVILYVEECL